MPLWCRYSRLVPIYALGDLEPSIHPDAYVHPDAVIIGDVRIGALSSVWPGAVLRGDDGYISIGERTSIQDNCVLHTTPIFPTVVGDDCVIGHLVHLDETGEVADAEVFDDVHEATGAKALAAVFGPEVTGPIALHVTAKRYRCATEPGYVDGLSPASVQSLRIQGGPLDADACATFAAHPAAAEAIRLRGYDDWGKLDDVDVPGWDHYRPMMERLARR